MGGDAHEVHRDAGGYRPLVSLGGCAKGADVCVLWHERIRHVFVGGSDGSVRALYDPALSKNGALLSVKRDHAPRKFLTSDTSHVDASSIVNPNALPMYRNDDAFRSRGRYAKTRNSQTLSKKPDPPLAQGQQGRNEGARTTFCQTFLENELAQGPGNIRNEDPREALLKYANEEPIFRTNATFYRDRCAPPAPRCHAWRRPNRKLGRSNSPWTGTLSQDSGRAAKPDGKQGGARTSLVAYSSALGAAIVGLSAQVREGGPAPGQNSKHNASNVYSAPRLLPARITGHPTRARAPGSRRHGARAPPRIITMASRKVRLKNRHCR